jgi:UDP-hydrolysing UDP-N-acetyl-D-glucosamine 2-epimerase
MSKKKISIVTTSRAEYGVIQWLIKDIAQDVKFEMHLIVTGAHLSPEFGLTYKEIENDGNLIDEKVDILLSTHDTAGIAKSMGRCAIGFCDVFERQKPDILIVTGDRYELLPICSTALVMNIPIAHISGGDITEGAIDNQIRNAISAMATYHFPGTKESGDRIIKMGADPNHVYVVGEPALDNFNRLKSLDRYELAKKNDLDIKKEWVLLTYHPETRLSLEENLTIVHTIIRCLKKLGNTQIIVTKANADFGGFQINEYLKSECSIKDSQFILFDNLGQLNYISLLKQLAFMIGNSSSGIIEAPSAKCPVINIGDRQKGRLLSINIINTSGDYSKINAAIKKIKSHRFLSSLEKIETPYGNGKSTQLIIEKLKLIFQVD